MKDKVIISASRRTDMLACQPDRLVAALRGALPSTRRLTPSRVHTLLISTKDHRNLLDRTDVREVCLDTDQVCVNLTVTGLGATLIEPNVPPPADVVRRVPELIEAVGDARRILWCFDPVLTAWGLSNRSANEFERIAEPLARAGVTRVLAAWYHPYQNGLLDAVKVGREERQAFADRLDGLAEKHGMLLSFCRMKGLHRLRCIDVEWLCAIHPEQDTSPISRYSRRVRPTPKHCRDAAWDIGWYLPSCPHRCAYCYASKHKVEPAS